MPGPGYTKANPHGKSIKNTAQYEALKKKGMSKSSAAAISNASLNKGQKKSKHRA